VKLLFAVVCALAGAFFLYLSFVSAPPQLWTLSELLVGAIAYGPMFGTSVLVAIFGPKNRQSALPWIKLGAMALCAAMAAGTGYNAAGAIFGITSTVLAWLIFIQLLRRPSISS
jgi:hypothetical protein